MKNIHRLLVLFALNEITKCEVKYAKNWSNNKPGNTWSNSINNNKNGNVLNKKEQHKNSWKNDHNYIYETKYRDQNGDYGYHIRNGDAEVWVHSYPTKKNSWSNNNNLNDRNHLQNKNDRNDNQFPGNTPQASEPEPYFYPAPAQPLTTEAPSTSSTPSATTLLPTTSETVENIEQYYPQTNFYSQNEIPNKIQSLFAQFPVIDLTKSLENSPQKKIAVMERKTQEDLPQMQMMSLPINVVPAAPISQSGFNMGQPNLVQMPILQAYQQPPNGFSNLQSVLMPTNTQQNLGALMNLQQNKPLLFPDVTAQQNSFGFINVPQGSSNNPFNVQIMNPVAEIIPDFNSNRPNENGPIKTETTLSVQENLQNMVNSPSIPASFSAMQQVNNGMPETVQILNSLPLIQVQMSQNSQQPTNDNHLSIQSKIPVVLKPSSPQPQQFLLQNSILPQFNSFQPPSNVNNYEIKGFPWVNNFNSVQLIPLESDLTSDRVRRSTNENEDGSVVIYNLVDRPWFNGHGYGYANNEENGIATTDKFEDVSEITAMENKESTTTKDMNMINDKISSLIAKQ